MSESTSTNSRSRRRGLSRASRWLVEHGPYALAVGALIQLAAGAFANIYTIRSFDHSLRTGHQWVVVTRRVADAVGLASRLGIPGNDVFVSRAPEREKARLHAALGRLKEAVQAVRVDVSAHQGDGHAGIVLTRLDDAWQAALRAAADSERVLTAAGHDDWDGAALAMVSMDGSTAVMNGAFATVTGEIANAQDADYAKDVARFGVLAQARTVAASACALLLLSGGVLGRRFYRAARERRLIAAAQQLALATAEYTADGGSARTVECCGHVPRTIRSASAAIRPSRLSNSDGT